MLTKRTGYAILALACLSDRDDQWILVQEIAARTDVPKPYLHKILHALGKNGVIRTKRGYRGGMALARPASEISLWDLVDAVEGLAWAQRCMLGLAECSAERACATHEFWAAERKEIEAKLKQISLAEVAEFEGRERGRLKSLDEVKKILEQSQT